MSVTLGIIGVGGLVYQFGSSFIDEFYKDIDDLKSRVTALEGRTTSSSSTTTTTDVPQNVKDQITANCNKVIFKTLKKFHYFLIIFQFSYLVWMR